MEETGFIVILLYILFAAAISRRIQGIIITLRIGSDFAVSSG